MSGEIPDIWLTLTRHLRRVGVKGLVTFQAALFARGGSDILWFA